MWPSRPACALSSKVLRASVSPACFPRVRDGWHRSRHGVFDGDDPREECPPRSEPQRHDFARSAWRSARGVGLHEELQAQGRNGRPNSLREDGRAPAEAVPASDTADKSRNAEVNFHGQKRSDETQASGYRSRRLPAKASQPSSALWRRACPFSVPAKGSRKRLAGARPLDPPPRPCCAEWNAGARRSPSRSLTAISPGCASHDRDPTHRCRQIQGCSP